MVSERRTKEHNLLNSGTFYQIADFTTTNFGEGPKMFKLIFNFFPHTPPTNREEEEGGGGGGGEYCTHLQLRAANRKTLNF